MNAPGSPSAAGCPNAFDQLAVDVPAVYKEFPLGVRKEPKSVWKGPSRRLYRTPLLPLSLRRNCWTALHRTHLDQAWFERFRIYWAQVLGGRPLWGVEDFYFLRNIYRVRFQSTFLPETQDTAVHLSTWQRPEVLNHLFHSVYKESLFHCLDLAGHLHTYLPSAQRILEYGCGTAPLTTTLFEFFRDTEKREIILSDIETAPFHYAAWKFAEFSNVQSVPLLSSQQFQLQLDAKVDAIFCMGVFEHLDQPLETVRRFASLLNPGGVLVFDYILSEAGGLDTSQGVRERPAVLEYVGKNFRLLHGKLDPSRSMATTVAQRV